jgi:transketolase C-terminal domain/subunit
MPGDAIETERLPEAIASVQGPCYIRICRNDMENIPAKMIHLFLKTSLLKDGSDYVIFRNRCHVFCRIGKLLRALKIIQFELSMSARLNL